MTDPAPVPPSLESHPDEWGTHPEASDAQATAPAGVDESTPTPHIPNLLHALLFLLLTALSFVAVGGIALALSGKLNPDTVASQREMLFVEGAAYLLALTAGWFLFPALWQRSFLNGIRWNARAASPLLIGFGLLLGLVAQATESLLPLPAHTPMDKLVQSTSLIWPLVFLGTFLAPLFEEIAFRGFLLPAFAYATDWLTTLIRHRDDLILWQQSTKTSTPALIASSILTSLIFGALHGPQLGASIPAVLVLATISLILSAVRLRTGSVAASTLVHASYNASLFLTLYIVSGGFKHLDRLR